MSNTVNFKGKAINFESRGKGSVVVLLHGFLGALQIWNHFSEELAKNYQVVAVDLPGHGQSEVLEEVHTMELMAESVKAVLDELSITECVISVRKKTYNLLFINNLVLKSSLNKMEVLFGH